MMITKTATAFFVGALIAGSAQAAPIYSGDSALIDFQTQAIVFDPLLDFQIRGTVYDYLCPHPDGGVLLYRGWPFSLPPAPGCIAFGGTSGLLWSVADYPLTYDPLVYFTPDNGLPDTSGSHSSYGTSGGVELTWTATAPSINAAPEPQTLAIFLAGLGLIGLMAGRKAA